MTCDIDYSDNSYMYSLCTIKLILSPIVFIYHSKFAVNQSEVMSTVLVRGIL